MDIACLLHDGGYSCVVENGGEVRPFLGRGVSDLYRLYKADASFLCGASVADKVVGKAAAVLMAAGGVAEVYADVISTGAFAMLAGVGVKIAYGIKVPFIIRRDGKGICPLEELCADVVVPGDGVERIASFMVRNGKL